MSLDSTQAAGRKGREVLARWQNTESGNSIAIGRSARGAISHMKILIVDGIYTVKGSTNWSLSGETEQDNELTLSRNAVIAAETRAQLDLNHDHMLKQMAKRREVGKKPRAKPKKQQTTRRTTAGSAATGRSRSRRPGSR
jgi:phosphatidylserine/phosphatidylglycerophosphate/cardiolipin synthase-like enzyme